MMARGRAAWWLSRVTKARAGQERAGAQRHRQQQGNGTAALHDPGQLCMPEDSSAHQHSTAHCRTALHSTAPPRTALHTPGLSRGRACCLGVLRAADQQDC